MNTLDVNIFDRFLFLSSPEFQVLGLGMQHLAVGDSKLRSYFSYFVFQAFGH
jgi:hypothetical protein